MRILVTGASGLVGSKTAELASKQGHQVFSSYKEHKAPHGKPVPLDLTNETQVKKTVSAVQPDAIINTVALTDVDLCEEDPDAAVLVNAASVAYLTSAAQDSRAFLVQVSTDYVFDGEKGNYSESENPRPINRYGVSKLQGERAAMVAQDDQWSIARASVVYGWGRHHRPNAATYVNNKLSKGERIHMLQDQFCSPTLNTNLANMLIEIAERRIPGTIHVSGATRLNRYDFAIRLAETLGLDKQLISAANAKDMNWKARRPRDSSLNVAKALQLLRHKPLPTDEALEEFREERVQLNPQQR